MSVKLIDITPNATQKIAYASYTCKGKSSNYKSFLDIPLEKAEKTVRFCIRDGHWSTGRHAECTFDLIMSRSASHQFVRSAFLGVLQESQRHVKFDNNFVIPESIKQNKTANLLYKNTLDGLKNTYFELLEMGVPKEDARYLLVNACQTKITVTFNFQSLMDFLLLRTHISAQWEIRQLANEMRDIMIKACPAFFDVLIDDKYEVSYNKCRKKESVK